jgi:hypothetical protein
MKSAYWLVCCGLGQGSRYRMLARRRSCCIRSSQLGGNTNNGPSGRTVCLVPMVSRYIYFTEFFICERQDSWNMDSVYVTIWVRLHKVGGYSTLAMSRLVGSTRPIIMMGFLSSLKPIQVIGLGLFPPDRDSGCLSSTLCCTISEIWPFWASVLHRSDFEICTGHLGYEIVPIYYLQIAQFSVHKVIRGTGCYKSLSWKCGGSSEI